MSSDPSTSSESFDNPAVNLTTGPVSGDSQALPLRRPEELPPVEPPSAGYIIQLFLIPALIVGALAAVVFLFGRLGDAESDWRQMVSELGSSNEHRRWRAAQGLSQLLWNDEVAVPEGQLPLAEQPIVIDGLAGLLKASLESRSVTDEDIRHQQFLARALGALRNDDKVMPVLAMAMAPEVSAEVRKSAAMSVAAIAGRHFEQATGYQTDAGGAPAGTAEDRRKSDVALPLAEATIRDPEVLKQLRLMTQDSDPALRHIAAFTIASVSGPECINQLKVVLLDADAKTRANAAVGLARNGSSEGFAVLRELLVECHKAYQPATTENATDDQSGGQAARLAAAQHEVEQATIARSCLRAVEDLWPILSGEQRQKMIDVIMSVADKQNAADVRLHAAQFLKDHSVQ
ncbi:MAG: HEAT repeat domain-containing protein [Planctomyces sp.]